jgi:hypothetical protein
VLRLAVMTGSIGELRRARYVSVGRRPAAVGGRVAACNEPRSCLGSASCRGCRYEPCGGVTLHGASRAAGTGVSGVHVTTCSFLRLRTRCVCNAVQSEEVDIDTSVRIEAFRAVVAVSDDVGRAYLRVSRVCVARAQAGPLAGISTRECAVDEGGRIGGVRLRASMRVRGAIVGMLQVARRRRSVCGAKPTSCAESGEAWGRDRRKWRGSLVS